MEESKSIKAISKVNIHLICSAQVMWFKMRKELYFWYFFFNLQVILNPGIALKELLENALDAKATNIDIRIQDQGLKSISVSDNGTGVKEVDFESLSKRGFFHSYFLRLNWQDKKNTSVVKMWNFQICSHLRIVSRFSSNFSILLM